MKKIVIGVCGLLVFIGGLASIRSGVLKAGELTNDSSLIVETGTAESQMSVPESNEAPVNEAVIPEANKKEPVVTPEIQSSEQGSAASSETEGSTTSEQSSTIDSSTSTSTPASSSSSSTSSSTKPSSSSSTSSTTKPSHSSSNSSTKPSGTKPSNTKPSSTTPSSSLLTQPSTSQTQEEPKQSATPAPTPVIPSTPAAEAPATPPTMSVQPYPFVAPTAPEAFSETSNLKLPSELKTTEVAQSDLKGFELPLLSSFENKAHAALIYEGIKQLGIEQEETYDAKQLATDLYQQLFSIEITDKPEKMPEEITVGSLVYQKEKDNHILLGISIGEDYYLTVDDVEIEKETTEEEAKETSDTEPEEKKTQRQVVVESIDLEEDLLIKELPEASLTEYGEQVLAEYPASMNFTENEGAKAFIKKIAEDAQKLGQDYDVFASVMIAQALIESGSGTSTLSLSPNHNLFGIKGTYQGQSVSMATQEDRGNGDLYSINSVFRKYPNYAASLGDYVELLRGGISGNGGYYKDAWRSTAKNYLRTTNALTGTYATDTTYGQKLNSIIALYHLTEYDQVKTDGAGSGVFIKGKEEIPEEYRSRMKYPDYNGVDYNSSGSYPVGQCTWYAFNRVKQLGKTVDDYMGNGGEWATKGKALGYEVSQKPKGGWLISFKPGVAGSDPRYGHVAFVEVVRPEGILISEGNVYGGTVISYRVIDTALATSDQVSYIKAK
ncbi:glucosaminidase domain-containing protein [Candidatus Enterococcus murrayae]|uniref:Glucosaminidase domain-containing protein n=1 Tax=Candidatus Enterococcus murrayae TaxID=2815321 RepID=A0ABS3HLY6_9ENTE|nr:glucosaminidase domain-containing protein [Enterococcus sp. MJM16]MBO0454461.1 glucosaminidase domain-containing protein [Enterococcus sp. MJM16]